jgi:hypothetical protein
MSVPRTTIIYYQDLMMGTCKFIDELLPAHGSPLITESEVKFLVNVIHQRDILNCGMSRKAIIGVIQGMTGKKIKNCENHYDYLIRQKRLPGLTEGGRIVTAQEITSKRTEVTTHHKSRWHNLIDSVWEDLLRLNKNADGCELYPSEDFDMLHPYFQLNFDATSMLANLSGLKVMGAKDIKQDMKNSDDSRVSIPALLVGASVGTTRPMIFLANGETMTSRSLLDYNLGDKHGALPGSTTIIAPSGYITYNAWEKVVPDLALGIRQRPAIRDHPNWWVCMILDGFGSHVSVHNALKILFVNEEADMSLLNQSYAQHVTACDNINVRTFLDLIRRRP